MYILVLYMWILLWFCPSSKIIHKTSKIVSTEQKKGEEGEGAFRKGAQSSVNLRLS